MSNFRFRLRPTASSQPFPEDNDEIIMGVEYGDDGSSEKYGYSLPLPWDAFPEVKDGRLVLRGFTHPGGPGRFNGECTVSWPLEAVPSELLLTAWVSLESAALIESLGWVVEPI